MYRIKVRVSGRLSEMLTRGRGRVVRTPKRRRKINFTHWGQLYSSIAAGVFRV